MKKRTPNPDIRIVNLYRKAINVPDGPQANDKGLWLATDYFDAFEVQKIDLNRLRFGLIEAINAKVPTMKDVATQSFPLVHNEEDDSQWNYCDAWGEPFDEDKTLYPFLSIIQTYISPEAFARNDINEKSPDSIYALTTSYYQDICAIVRDFWSNNRGRLFKFKIYRSLSVGDFAVVICSKEADIPYYISTAMRRRRAVRHDTFHEHADAKDIVIYKTYTILSMHNSWIQDDLYTGATNSHFILRCCYSNRYWIQRSCNNEELKMHEGVISEKLNRLTGRYDFSVNLTDQRFGHILRDLQKYKLGVSVSYENNDHFHTANQSDYDEADYLHFLIINRYLSHVNERFSFSFSEKNSLISSESGICLQNEKAILDYTDYKNQEYLKNVKRKYENTFNEVRKIPGYHKNLDTNMRLLSRLIDMCGTLNGLSDMRIYCTLVLNYLEVLMNNLNHYCNGINKHERYELVSYMDSALGSMIYILNAYIDYVRNNNLQSLQTPNYNIESNLSLEKYLIGYSGFIEELLQCYKQAFDFLETEWYVKGGTRSFEPVVVPQVENEVLTVQVFFPRFDFSDVDDVKRLMIVKCPTFCELTNIAEMTATLIHETAHRFRYECRDKRNYVIAYYIARRAFDGAAKEIMADIRREFQHLPLLERYYLSLNDEMAKCYLGIFYPELNHESSSKRRPLFKGNDANEYPMRLLGQRMQDDYRAFVEADTYFDEYDSKLRRFLDTVGENINFSNSDNQKAFHTLICFKDEYINFGKIEGEVAREKFTDLFKETEKAIKKLCPEYDKNERHENERSLLSATGEDAKRAFDILLDCLSDMERKENHYYNARIINKRQEFYEELHLSICNKITAAKKKNVKIEMEVARYLCVDFNSDGNRKVFTEILEKKIQSMLEPSIDLAKRSVFAYRELTADLFMVKLLDLDSFGYLLISARNLPMGRDPLDLHLRRVANVLYVSNREPNEKEWKLIIEEKLWNKAQVVIIQMLEKSVNDLKNYDRIPNSQDISKLFFNVFTALFNGMNSKTSIAPLDILNAVLNAMDDLRDVIEERYISDKNEYLRYTLLELTTYCNVLKYIRSLSLHGWRHIEELKVYTTLKEDLVDGYNKIQVMHEKIHKGSLAKHFEAVKAYYNNPYEKENIDSENNNLEMLGFILRMFYKKKIQTAGDLLTYGSKY